MASNFKIFLEKKSKAVHMKLLGDFDGSSACELINILKEYCDKVEKIFIHTCGLSSIHPFGLDVFQRAYNHFRKYPYEIVFTGEHRGIIEPSELCMV